jgi:hypothetical protein
MPVGQRQGFTQEEHDFVVKCVREGTTVQYCAAKLGRSESGIVQHAARIDLHFRNAKKNRGYSRKYG